MTNFPAEIAELVAKLTLAEKARVVSGETMWKTYALPSIGLRSMTLSDGPSGVRGPIWDERHPSLTLPSASCVAATWDRGLLGKIGHISASEARSKGVDVVLGPTINLHRSPLGGRHFEAYSEDPLLTGELAVAYVSGLQDQGVAGTPKHYVANDSENERFTLNAVLDEQTLHEVYLAPFEQTVREARTWSIMSSYNSINGVTGSENPLLRDPLSTVWGFDGMVMSDWTAVRTVVESGNGGNDLAMPGPHTPWAEGLEAAVRNGLVSESALDEKIARILLLAKRVGALGSSSPKPVEPIDSRVEIRRIAADGMVLVQNSGVLPLAKPTSVALIGSHAKFGRIQGGGSATTVSQAPVHPLAGLKAGGANVSYFTGYHAVDSLDDFPLDQIENGEIVLDWIDLDGKSHLRESRHAGFYLADTADLGPSVKGFRASVRFTANEDGLHRFGGGGIGTHVYRVDGTSKHSDKLEIHEGMDLAEAFLAPPQTFFDIQLSSGQSVTIELEFFGGLPEYMSGFSGFFGYRAPRLSEAEEWAKAIAGAREAEVAVVVVGTTALVESEGFDRKDLQLPGRQNELVEAIAAVNPNTVVVVNAGSPVELPWKDKVSAILLTWFPGEEYGNALSDVLYGSAEPGGRLPTTWGSLNEAPVTNTDPTDGQLHYSEGINIGYRAWIKHGRKPNFWFGHGLGYTSFEFSEMSVASSANTSEPLAVSVKVTNTGKRAGSEVVQVYLRRKETSVNRPPLWLAGFEKVSVEAGATVSVIISVDPRRFAHYESGWQFEAGEFEVLVGKSAELVGALSGTVQLLK
jgi:beta-glucosidase